MSREKFEAWWEQWFGEPPMSGWQELRCEEGYSAEEIDHMWDAWQAATASMQAERDQLAAECAAQKSALEWLYEAVSMPDSGPVPDKYYSAVTNAAAVMYENPTTDRFLAEQRAIGVEMLAEFCRTGNNGHEIHPDIEEIIVFAAQLRKGVKV